MTFQIDDIFQKRHNLKFPFAFVKRKKRPFIFSHYLCGRLRLHHKNQNFVRITTRLRYYLQYPSKIANQDERITRAEYIFYYIFCFFHNIRLTGKRHYKRLTENFVKCQKKHNCLNTTKEKNKTDIYVTITHHEELVKKTILYVWKYEIDIRVKKQNCPAFCAKQVANDAKKTARYDHM